MPAPCSPSRPASLLVADPLRALVATLGDHVQESEQEQEDEEEEGGEDSDDSSLPAQVREAKRAMTASLSKEQKAVTMQWRRKVRDADTKKKQGKLADEGAYDLAKKLYLLADEGFVDGSEDPPTGEYEVRAPRVPAFVMFLPDSSSRSRSTSCWSRLARLQRRTTRRRKASRLRRRRRRQRLRRRLRLRQGLRGRRRLRRRGTRRKRRSRRPSGSRPSWTSSTRACRSTRRRSSTSKAASGSAAPR